jgi:4-hydroxy-tetrahydrodipicolinate reductase
VAIEFTVPNKAVDNYRRAWAAGVPVVSGTTGWNAVLPELKKEIAEKGYTLFWASNFSLGVNLFFELNKRLAAMMNRYANYDVDMTEIHHTEKKDAPSGTAITLAEGILENLDRKEEWALVDGQQSADGGRLGIVALREGKVPGTHIVRYDSAVDTITIKHEAKSREGFALGAVVAAEFLVGKPAGFYSMIDLMK